jgi:hypothetical protein
VHRSTGAATRKPPVRRIPWRALTDETMAADQVWSALPEDQATREDVEQFFEAEGLTASAAGPDVLYAYADGDRPQESVVQSEWLIEFHFTDAIADVLLIEKRLIGP